MSIKVMAVGLIAGHKALPAHTGQLLMDHEYESFG